MIPAGFGMKRLRPLMLNRQTRATPLWAEDLTISPGRLLYSCRRRTSGGLGMGRQGRLRRKRCATMIVIGASCLTSRLEFVLNSRIS